MSQEQLRQQMEGQSGNTGSKEGDTGGKEGESGRPQGEGQSEKEGNGQEGAQEQGNGEGNSGRNGNSGKNAEGDRQSGEGQEMDYGEIFEIYKQQQRIRQELEKQLTDLINSEDQELAKRISQEMERFEEELLRTGITEKTADRLNRIQQQLMKLENAALKQGRKKERESNTNREAFTNPILSKPDIRLEKEGELEYLNKQVLPLHRLYRNKVQLYFRENDSLSRGN